MISSPPIGSKSRWPAQAKQAAIEELVDLLCDSAGIEARTELKDAVWQREMTRTTGIGHGVAIPHGKSTQCQELQLVLGKPSAPMDFGSIDGRPVNLIILLVSPANETGPHIQALATISRMLTHENLRASIRDAKTPEEVYAIIAKHDVESAQ